MKKINPLNLVFAFAILTIASCEPEETKVPVAGVTLNTTEHSMAIDENFQLTVTITPDNASNKTISWSSSAGGVATVDNSGLVTSHSDGVAIIRVNTEDGDFEAACTVTVQPDAIHVSGMDIDITSDTLDLGCTLQLTATITPIDATNKTISWQSSNVAVATVSPSGLITGVGGGSTTITATTNDGAHTATCQVWVIGKGTIVTLMDKGFLKTTGNNVGVDLAIDVSGIPYIALNAYNADLQADTKASCEVWKYSTGTNWNQFASRVAITDDEAYAPGICIDESGNVYVSHLYYDNLSDDKYNANVVAYSAGGAWTYLGSGATSLVKNGSTPLNRGSELALKNDGTLLVANMYYGDGYVHYWDNSWKSYNGYKTDGSGFWAGGIEIECFGNKPLVSVRTGSGEGITGVLYGNESNGVSGQWAWLGGSYASSASHDCGFQDEVVNNASLAVNSKGDVFTAYKAYFDGEYHIIVKRFDAGASSWTQIYSEAGNPNQVDVVVANDQAYLVVAAYDDGISLYRLTVCGNWIYEGKTARPDTYYNFDAIAGVNGEVIIGYECTYASSGSVGVVKYIPYSY